MKMEDLRIGNYYLSTKFKVPVVCTLSDFVEISHRCEDNDPHADANELFEPLPLTEELLKKIDIKCYNEDSNEYLEDVIIRGYKGNFYYALDSFENNCGGWCSTTQQIEFVHELQDIYRIHLGEELVIHI